MPALFRRLGPRHRPVRGAPPGPAPREPALVRRRRAAAEAAWVGAGAGPSPTRPPRRRGPDHGEAIGVERLALRRTGRDTC